MDSPPHRANLLMEGAELVIGYAEATAGRYRCAALPIGLIP
jgi:hypothetical protein